MNRCFVFCLLIIVPHFEATAFEQEIHAGCAVIDISPRTLPAIRNGGFLEQTADRVDDPLYARCLALTSGNDTVVISIVDSCMVPRDICDKIKRNVFERTQVPSSQQLIAATHTHTAPSLMDFCLGSRKDPNYEDWFVSQVSAGMVEAIENQQPARIGWTVVDAPNHTHCRRWLKHPDHIGQDPFGQQSVRAMMHPGYQNAEYLGPSGPVDSLLSIINVQTRSGEPLCLFANYSMHYFGADAFSADYFGDFAREIESKLSSKPPENGSTRFVAIMSQGTSGDQHWMDYSQPVRRDYTRQQYAAELAEITIGAFPQIEYHSELPIKATVWGLLSQRRVPDEARLAWARELNAARGELRPRNLPEVYAEQAEWLEKNPEVLLPLQVIRIGDLGIAAIPNEVFGITGLKLKAQSPLQPLVNIGLANGAEGYIPPPEQHALGGYTTWPARTAGLEVGVEPEIVAGLLSMLEQLSNQKRKPLTKDFYNPQQRAAIQRAGYPMPDGTGR